MIGDLLQPTHLLFVLIIALLVLGPKRLPEVGRALGRGLRDFRNAINGEELPEQTVPPTVTGTSTSQAPAAGTSTETPLPAKEPAAPTPEVATTAHETAPAHGSNEQTEAATSVMQSDTTH